MTPKERSDIMACLLQLNKLLEAAGKIQAGQTAHKVTQAIKALENDQREPEPQPVADRHEDISRFLGPGATASLMFSSPNGATVVGMGRLARVTSERGWDWGPLRYNVEIVSAGPWRAL